MAMKYNLSGLDCATCAAEIETCLIKDKKISDAHVDFASGKLYVTYKDDSMTEAELQKRIHKQNKEVTVSRDGALRSKAPIFSKRIQWISIRIFISAVLLAVAIFVPLDFMVQIVIFGIAYLVVSYDIIWQAIKNIISLEEIFDENALMSVATIGAFAIGQYSEAVLVILLYQIGEILEDIAINKSRNSIMAAIDLRPDTANLYKDGQIKLVSPTELDVDDTILVKVGEVVPVDGQVLSGEGFLDVSSLTGEPMPVVVKADSTVFSGSILKSGTLTLIVTKKFQDSAMSKILDLVTNNGDRKAKAEKFITRFSKIYTPIVFLLALILAIVPPLFTGQWSEYLYRALIFLVISCPCAIIISVPLTYFAGLGLASKHGIIIKGANFLDRLCDIESLMFDKTGTITKGTFAVEKIKPTDIDNDEFIKTIVAVESLSSHPIAKAVVSSFGIKPDTSGVTDFTEILGMGITAKYGGHLIVLGNETLLIENNIYFLASTDIGNIIHLAIDGVYKGFIVLNDEVKKNSRNLITELRGRGISTIMLTGDHQANAEYVAYQLNVDQTYYELMPQDKLSRLEIEMMKRKGAVAFVGDGVNDAPSIVRADVGIAMGGIGSDLAVENADVVIMNDDPMKVVDAIDIAHLARRRAIFNIAFALLIKTAVLVLAAFGLEQMWVAILADVGVSILLIFNSLMLLKKQF
ncbi:MAG: heavy metal translocating P-type ATPase [Firmicutes bacterium]|nr:heavy metal translocating P-type ATPase [Bacillota bacterium]